MSVYGRFTETDENLSGLVSPPRSLHLFLPNITRQALTYPLLHLGYTVAVMRLSKLVLALLLQQSVLASRPAKRHYDTHDYYVLEHNPSADASLDECAQTLGVEVVEQAGELQNHWLVRTTKQQLSSRDSQDRVLRALDAVRARAQSPTYSRSEDGHLSRRVSSAVKYLSRQELRQRVKRAPPPISPGSLIDAPTAQEVAEQQQILDPEFTKQWHLVNDDYPQHMMNVSALWEKGITGKGVITTLVDDGLDYNSDDLAANFVRFYVHSGLYYANCVCSTHPALMIITTTPTFRRQSSSMIIMAPAVLAKSLLPRTMFVESVLLMTLKLLESAFYQAPSLISTKPHP